MLILLLFILGLTLAASLQKRPPFPAGFDYLSNIDLNILQFPRYAIPGNFVGQTIDGYKANQIVISVKAGLALSKVQQQLNKLGYLLLVYDAYRPQKAVDRFVRWCEQPQNNKTKAQFYPHLNKNVLIPDYIASKSGHSRGSTVDLTIIELNKKMHEIKLYNTTLTNGQSILYRDDGSEFMCSHFDYFGESSHHDTTLVTQDCLNKRNMLRILMVTNGFRPLSTEWWHYTLVEQPFPTSYFDFDIV